jgi:metal-responsive CopG/Arc/MetJ family transcriptional regulator
MRTIVDLPDEQIEALKALSARENVSRAELVRRALAEFLAHRSTLHDDDAFGLWRRRPEDGLEYQHRLRKEWDE